MTGEAGKQKTLQTAKRQTGRADAAWALNVTNTIVVMC